MSRSLLVYDGRARWLRAVADAVTRCSDVTPVPWESDAIQAFLRAQFDSRPFAFMLIDDDTVHVGSETVERVLRRRGVSAPVSGLFGRVYPFAAGPLGRLFHGREPADLDGSFPLTEGARAHIDPLRSARTIPVDAE
jgi:hypothetical protein